MGLPVQAVKKVLKDFFDSLLMSRFTTRCAGQTPATQVFADIQSNSRRALPPRAPPHSRQSIFSARWFFDKLNR